MLSQPVRWGHSAVRRKGLPRLAICESARIDDRERCFVQSRIHTVHNALALRTEPLTHRGLARPQCDEVLKHSCPELHVSQVPNFCGAIDELAVVLMLLC